MAANDPAPDIRALSFGASFTNRVTLSPTADPSAISGASGPSTAPKHSVPSAASATPGACASGVGAVLRPPSGECPPSPGSSLRAAITTHAPTAGSPTTRYQAGSSHSQSSTSWTAARKSAATSAAGTPIAAARRTSRR
jgi:hypothetical protein